jgi:formiminotetrahydrofolate cyclodeaminase
MLNPDAKSARLRDLSLEEFCLQLASASPTPGGGTGAAAAGAMGAALVRMLCLLTLGKPKYAEHERLLTAIAETCEEARLAFLDLAEEDAQAYDAVGAAMKLPKATPDEQARRTEALQRALKGACEVPLKVMERALEVIGIAKSAVQVGNKNAASDGAAGAALCRAALTVAAYNVRINLVAIHDTTFVKDMRTRLDEMLYMGTAVAQEIDSLVHDLWAPKPAPRPGAPA